RRRASDRSEHYVRDVRERMTHGSLIKPEFEYELLSTLARAEVSIGLVLPALAVAFAAAFLLWVPLVHIALWLGLVLAAKGVTAWACQGFLSAPRASVHIGSWRHR
ncbi:hypothetical protein ACTGXK_11770, partial [Streptococcus suis]